MRKTGVIRIGDAFSRETRADGVLYLDNPPGSFDPQESVERGKPQFKAQKGEVRLQKKHLVLNDFDPADWEGLPDLNLSFWMGALSPDQKHRLLNRLRKQAVLHELLREGFDIFVFQNGVVKPVSHDDISRGFRGYRQHASSDELSSIVCQQLSKQTKKSLPRKNFLTLNAVEMQSLLTNQRDGKTWISYSDLSQVENESDLNYLIRYLQGETRLGIVADHFDRFSQALVIKEQAELPVDLGLVRINGNTIVKVPGLPGRGPLLSGLDFDQASQARHLILEKLYSLREYYEGPALPDFTDTEKELLNRIVKRVKKLSLLDNILDELDVTKLLTGCNELESLECSADSECADRSESRVNIVLRVGKAQKAFQKLTHLSLANCFSKALQVDAPALKFLELTNLAFYDDAPFSLEPSTKSSVEKLCLMNCVELEPRTREMKTAQNDLIVKLIQELPQLRELSLEDMVLDATKITRPLSKLTHLSIGRLDDYRTPWDVDDLSALLSKTPALKTLTFSLNSMSQEEHSSLDDIAPLRDLERIEIVDAVFTSVDLKALLRKTPNLKKLIIHHPYSDLLGLNDDLSLQDEELAELLEGIDFTTIGRTRKYDTSDVSADAESSPSASDRATSGKAGKSSGKETGGVGAGASGGGEKRSGQTEGRITQRSHQQKEYIDANTTNDPFSSRELNKIFISKDRMPWRDYFRTPMYRMDVYDTLEINPKRCSEEKAFIIKKQQLRDITPVSDAVVLRDSKEVLAAFKALKDDQEKKHFRAKTNIKINQNWQALPSLSPHETLTHWMVEEGVDDIELGYSEANNLYYVRKKSPGEKTVAVEFIIYDRIKEHKPAATSLSPEVKDIFDSCSKFSGEFTGKRLTVPENATGQDYIDAMKKEKVGACRHRSIVFFHRINELNESKAEAEKIKVRYISSDCHAYVEVKEPGPDKDWVTCNLGGAIVIPKLHQSDIAVSETEARMVERLAARAMESGESVASDDVQIPLDESDVADDVVLAPPPIQDYLKSCCESAEKKYLIRVNEGESLDKLSLALQEHCKVNDRPYFYVDSPRDLVCAADYIERLSGNRGKEKKGPGGPLYDFLTQPFAEGVSPVLIVNFDRFTAEDFAKYNSLLDRIRQVDGVAVPPAMTIVGLINPFKPGAYHDSSFYSRFGDEKPIFPYRAEALETPSAIMPLPEDESERPSAFDCHASVDWQDQLLGQWCLDENGFYFEEGDLLKALRDQPPMIEIANPPATRQFARFWNEAKLKGYIEHRGIKIDLHTDFSVKTRDHVTLNPRCITTVTQLSDQEDVPANAHPLNETLFQQFLFQQNFSAGQLKREDGILKANAGKEITVYLTDALDPHTWSWFIEASEKNRVTVNLLVAPGVAVPDFLTARSTESLVVLPPKKETYEARKSSAPKNRYIHSTDRDATVTQLKNKNGGRSVLVIDVSEKTPNDLLDYVSGKKGDTGFQFSKIPAVVKEQLAQNKTVVLHGHFSAALQHELTKLLLERKHNADSRGQLILVSEEETTLGSVCAVEPHVVTTAEKKSMLSDEFGERFDYFDRARSVRLKLKYTSFEKAFDDARIGRHALTTLRAIAHREWIAESLYRDKKERELASRDSQQQSRGESSRASDALSRGSISVSTSDALSRGALQSQEQSRGYSAYFEHGGRASLHHLIGTQTAPGQRESLVTQHRGDDLDHAAEIVDAFNQKRKEDVKRILEDQPFVFLAGISGVGKTTFVRNNFQRGGFKFYEGEEKIAKWAEDELGGEFKILFIDEANITQKQWSEFEGLFDNPPHIVINGELKILTPKHKIIFAGNPASYSDDRQVPSFIQRHGNSVWMKPFPPAYLYNEILLPVLGSASLGTATTIDVAKPILSVAQFLTNCSKDEVLITPRELAMMALLTKSHYLKNPGDDPVAVAAYYAYQLSETFVPKERLAEFKERFKPTWSPREEIKLVTQLGEEPFSLCESNTPSARMLSDFLSLRACRVANKPGFDLDHQKSAGLGGVLIEGEPGLGKSELVLQLLKHHKIKEEGDPTATVLDPGKYYKIQSGWTKEQVDEFLHKAFHAGVVVIWDEMNSSGLSIERLLNNLLMGKDKHGKPAENAGFMLIGTQNPAMMMDGRDMTSPAILHRMHYRVLPHYSEKEMAEILRKKAVPESMADALIVRYQRQRVKDKKCCFRDLNRDAEAAALTDKAISQYAIEQRVYNATVAPQLSDEEISTLGPRAQAALIAHPGVTAKELAVLAGKVSSPDLLKEIMKKPMLSEDVYLKLASNPYMTNELLFEVAKRAHREDTLMTASAHRYCDDAVREKLFNNSAASHTVVHKVGAETKQLSLRQKVVEYETRYPECDLSGFDLTKIDLIKIKLNASVKLKNATITSSQLNYLAKFTTDFSGVTVIGDGEKIKHKKGLQLNFTGADLQKAEFDEAKSYRECIFSDAKVSSKQFFHMSALRLLTETYQKGTELPIVMADLSQLDLTRFDLSKAPITEDTKMSGAKLTSLQVNQLYAKGVRDFDAVIIVNDKENTLIEHDVFKNATFTKARIPADQIERAYVGVTHKKEHAPVTEFKGFIVEGKKLKLDWRFDYDWQTATPVVSRERSVSGASSDDDVARQKDPSIPRSASTPFLPRDEGVSPHSEALSHEREAGAIPTLEEPLLAATRDSSRAETLQRDASIPQEDHEVGKMTYRLRRPLTLINVDLSGVEVNFRDFTTLEDLTTENVFINEAQKAQLKDKPGTAKFLVKSPSVSGTAGLFGKSDKKESLSEMALKKPTGSSPRS